MRRAFTLLEILTVIGIIGIVTATCVVGLGTGKEAARMKGASRDVFAAMRQARSIALVTKEPAIVTYSTVKRGEAFCGKVEIHSAKLLETRHGKAWTISGEEVELDPEAEETTTSLTKDGKSVVDAETKEDGSDFGESLADVLFAPIADEVMEGICLKVTFDDSSLDDDPESDRQKAKISVFSNADYLLGRFSDAREREKAESAASDEQTAETPADETQKAVSLTWEANGRCSRPHRVWIYREGTDPKEGVSVKVDRFGAAKILAAGED